MNKLNDFYRFLVGFFSYSIMFFLLFYVLAGSTPSHAAETELVGCDIGFSSGSSKPIVMCDNPRYTQDDLKYFDSL
jgi:hypothetical protein